MKQAYLADAVSAVPPSSGASSVGNPTDGDPANNVLATAFGAYAAYQLFKEIENVITDAGLTPDVDVLTQLRDAIDAKISAAGGLDTTTGDARWLRRALNLSDIGNVGTARNNLSVYSRAQVDQAIADLVDSSPGALDTLNELAAALGDDANFSTTVNNAIALRAPIAAPLLTGNARSSTPPDDDDSTRIATTGWVKDNAGGGGRRQPGFF